MKKLTLMLLAVLVICYGCVSTKTYDTLSAEKEATKTELEKTAEELAATKGELYTTQSELEAVKATAAELASTLDARDAELKALKDEKAELTKKKEYLEREVERLQIKAGELSAEKAREVENLKRTYDDLVKEMQLEIEQGDIKITQAVDRLSVNMVDKILFDSGKAEVKPEGLEVLKRVGDILAKIKDKQIRVEGHTDNVPIGPRLQKKYASNWELSTARATTVARYLEDNVGIDPALLSAAGYSKYRPVAENETDEGKAQNRRIEIVLLPLDVDRVLEELKK